MTYSCTRKYKHAVFCCCCTTEISNTRKDMFVHVFRIRLSKMSWLFMCLCLLLWEISSSNPLDLENSDTDSRNDEKWLGALPYMEYLLEDPNYRPMISVIPASGIMIFVVENFGIRT